MNEKKPTYRVEIENSGTPPNDAYGWKIYRNHDVLPILRSQQLFITRMAGLPLYPKLEKAEHGRANRDELHASNLISMTLISATYGWRFR
jgi:hypothetical protein